MHEHRRDEHQAAPVQIYRAVCGDSDDAPSSPSSHRTSGCSPSRAAAQPPRVSASARCNTSRSRIASSCGQSGAIRACPEPLEQLASRATTSARPRNHRRPPGRADGCAGLPDLATGRGARSRRTAARSSATERAIPVGGGARKSGPQAEAATIGSPGSQGRLVARGSARTSAPGRRGPGPPRLGDWASRRMRSSSSVSGAFRTGSRRGR